jgi:hypothetical protein
MIDPAIFREYDIRGTYGRNLSDDDAYAIGRGVAVAFRQRGGQGMAVGRDGRLSSPALEAALVEGLRDGGVDVLRIGIGPTPMLYYAEASMQQVQGGIHVTGSHNPRDDNGFKIVFLGVRSSVPKSSGSALWPWRRLERVISSIAAWWKRWMSCPPISSASPKGCCRNGMTLSAPCPSVGMRAMAPPVPPSSG